jgi:hypothetical protein
MLRFAAAAALLALSVSAQDGIRWLDNFEEAKKESRATGKPIFLEFRCEA